LGIMRNFLDIGAVVLVCLVALVAIELFTVIPELPEPLHWITWHANPLAIPAAFLGLYLLWHMVKGRRVGWLVATLFLAPVALLAYYWRNVRPELTTHYAQQAVAADRPKTGSG